MRKNLIETKPLASEEDSATKDKWLDIDAIATVEITSEDPQFPVEQAVAVSSSTGWRAAAKGPQFIRFNFDKPTSIDRIQIHFVERDADRCQEFAIYTKSGTGESREVVRQQFTFSPGGATEELEDYTVALSAVTSLELRIDPDRAHDPTHSQNFATLQSLRLA